MRVVTSLPYEIKEDEHVVVPTTDGTRLAARIWRPLDSDEHPVPAILEYIPYRKRDLTSVRDSIAHPYLAGHGFACVRVDIRGSGDSDGVLVDEYLEQEQRDAEDVLAWLAAQPWCDGTTGMMGISWGGFSALQVAARQPPSLGAICIASFTDDRFADDMHYMRGCMLSDNLAESGTMFAYSVCPPDPALAGADWRRMWTERLDAARPWVAEWLRHQRRDDYWRHASVCEDFSAIRVPVFASCGWADGYSNAVLRLVEGLDVPRKGLIGPWSHKYPHLGVPGPAIGYLQEVVRWFDRWLRNGESDVDEPVLRTWMQDSVPPSTSYEQRPGRWVGEPSWPSPNIRRDLHPLAPHRIAHRDAKVPVDVVTIESPLSVGQFAGKWSSYSAPPDLPYDQREEDGGSLVFTSDVLTEQCEILGSPVVRLDVSADRPVAMVAARLSDVAEDGRATRVTYGLLNLCHRDSHDHPEPLVPGRRYQVEVPLNGVAQAFPAGHRIRLSLSTSYWPLAWPPPEPVRLSVHTAGSFLELPIRPVAAPDEVSLRPFDEPEGTRPLATTVLEQGDYRWDVGRSMITYDSALDVVKDTGVVRYEDTGTEIRKDVRERYSWTADDYSSVRGETEWVMTFARGDWATRIETRQVLTCTPTDFHLHARLDAFEGQTRVRSRNWTMTFPRDHL
ncbi:CocE/NonD family hydrolase [Actinophytocola gossypii]|uniref:CocE/NonD family hydrolase n=1 Tax=Actinophytocola gossypii TaxID=2812003 RepID=A0ABT2J8X9_9PSEU|nr:CocE/NonD family hydrolase [Actinophytocola gossypii]MCT2584323.1 CocE/NonD family hydrolase [Actinophytocola gossypii]